MAKTQVEKRGPSYAGGSPSKSHRGDVPNKVFAASDPAFRAKCEAAGCQPTGRQASKYRNGKGSAFKS